MSIEDVVRRIEEGWLVDAPPSLSGVSPKAKKVPGVFNVGDRVRITDESGHIFKHGEIVIIKSVYCNSDDLFVCTLEDGTIPLERGGSGCSAVFKWEMIHA